MRGFTLTGALLVCFQLLPSLSVHAADSLYDRLGGKPVMTGIVKQTIALVANDPRVNQSFDQINIEKLNQKIVEHLCSISGGGCVYTGDDMKRVHQGLKINERAFYALVEALQHSLDQHGVGEREKNELLFILAPMKRLIVE